MTDIQTRYFYAMKSRIMANANVHIYELEQDAEWALFCAYNETGISMHLDKNLVETQLQVKTWLTENRLKIIKIKVEIPI